ncbi:hypothetical protein ASG19_07150 [Rhizobium sp. Leaf306]|uniref:hypothetical protein n=1 Tax=Rhizobium sp. Leaf306 TaxID=1736330 RepID=UPI0007130B55|nr:hypothetical protein [Rhizobium sp. Leaf306]KQQ38780.1 hypothetical protein ASG19_07150 [Rhizobium sp. Leaf306]
MSGGQAQSPVSTQKDGDSSPSSMYEVQRAEVSLMVTKDSGLRAKAEITNRGLLSVAVLVSSILLSTAVLVHVAITADRRRR